MSSLMPGHRRRTLPVAAAALGLLMLAPVALPAQAAPGITGNAIDRSPAPKPTATAGKGLKSGDTAFVDVTAATLWTDSDSPRSIDSDALSNPVDLKGWNSALSSTEKRRALTGKTQTQALLGDEVRILDVAGDWVEVAVASQKAPGEKHGYPGWVPKKQLVENRSYEKTRSKNDTAIVTVKSAGLSLRPHGEHTEEATFNTELPVLARTSDEIRVATPDGTPFWIDADDVTIYEQGEGPKKPKPSQLVSTARQFLDLRYLWAGTSAYGFDCSGFTYTIFRAHGIDLPRDSGPQSKAGTAVDRSDIAVGDLIFFAGNGGSGTVHHVGMYIGHGEMIHAPNASKSVEIVDWESWDSGGQYAGARRYI